MDSVSSDLKYYLAEHEMETNLLQEAFLYHYSGIFDPPSFLYALPFLIVGTQSISTFPSADNTSFTNYHYWTMTHPFLADDDNARTSFRAMYRMDRLNFEKLVNDLRQHPVFDLRAHNSIPVYIQISCAIWQLANCHLGYRTNNIAFCVSHGNYINFFRRTLVAIEGVYENNIIWPFDQERVQAVQTGFEWLHTVILHLKIKFFIWPIINFLECSSFLPAHYHFYFTT